jgi:hypothetical protein
MAGHDSETRRELIRGFLPARSHAPAITFISLLYILVTVFENAFASLTSLSALSWVELTGVLPIASAVVFGPSALWGILAGTALSDVASNAFGPSAFVGVAVHLYLGYAASKLAQKFDIDAFVSPSYFARRSTLGQFLLLVTVPVAGASAIAGWGGEIVHTAPFFFLTTRTFVELLCLNLVFTLPLVELCRLVASTSAVRFDALPSDSGDRDGRFDLWRVVGVTLTWVVLGTIGSLGYRTFEKIPPGYFWSNNNEAVLLLLDRPELFGLGAGRVQVVFGALLFSLLVSTFVRDSGRREGTS